MVIYYALFILIAICDLRFHVIPKGLNFLGLGVLILATPNHLLGFLIFNTLITYLFYCGVYRVSRGKMGYGDVRLAPLPATFNESHPFPIHLLAWLLAGVATLFRRDLGRELPFAPFFLVATFIFNQL
ncbi:MAG: prepilin peptidase [Candidatus Nanopelagicaceae bacterium]